MNAPKPAPPRRKPIPAEQLRGYALRHGNSDWLIHELTRTGQTVTLADLDAERRRRKKNTPDPNPHASRQKRLKFKENENV